MNLKSESYATDPHKNTFSEVKSSPTLMHSSEPDIWNEPVASNAIKTNAFAPILETELSFDQRVLRT